MLFLIASLLLPHIAHAWQVPHSEISSASLASLEEARSYLFPNEALIGVFTYLREDGYVSRVSSWSRPGIIRERLFACPSVPMTENLTCDFIGDEGVEYRPHETAPKNPALIEVYLRFGTAVFEERVRPPSSIHSLLLWGMPDAVELEIHSGDLDEKIQRTRILCEERSSFSCEVLKEKEEIRLLLP